MLGDGYHGGIDDSKREVCVGLHKLGHALDVLVLHFSDVKALPPNDFRKVASACGPTRD